MAYRDEDFANAFSELDAELYQASEDERQGDARQQATNAALREKYPSLRR